MSKVRNGKKSVKCLEDFKKQQHRNIVNVKAKKGNNEIYSNITRGRRSGLRKWSNENEQNNSLEKIRVNVSNKSSPSQPSDIKKNRILKFSDSDSGGEEEEVYEGNRTSATKKWYHTVPEDPDDFKVLPDGDVSRMKQDAKCFLENDTLHYKNACSSGPGRSENEWLETMWMKGTSQDKIAAGVIIIQNSPLHGLSVLHSIVSLVKPGKKECLKAMDVLSDLFISDLLLANRKLKYFEKRPHCILNELGSGSLPTKKLYLMHWYFEDQLKLEYHQFVQNILLVARDCVENTKEKAVVVMQRLLSGSPEQEALLLSSLINKLGDPSQKVSSKVIFCLTKLLHDHPNMKMVVTGEIEKILFRTNIRPRAQYYAFCLLTQFLLSKDEEELAVKLIQLYFAFFKSCLKKGEVDSRMMNILLTGVNRAYPFAKQDMLKVNEHVEMLYKVVHMANIGVSLHALHLLYLVADYDTGVSDRFYSALYRKLLDPELAKSSSHALFLSLIFRALSKDVQDSRIRAFIKRLFQICHYVPVPFACGILIVISELLKANKNLYALTMFVTNFKTDGEESEEEWYADIKLEEEESNAIDGTSTTVIKEENIEEKKTEIPSWDHHKNIKSTYSGTLSYDGYARNPLFSGGEGCVYTELVSLTTHFHPTVSLFASRLLHGENIDYSGDPLIDFALPKFLERFVFRNPKKIEVGLKEKPFSKLSRKWSYVPKGFRNLPIKGEQYRGAAESIIPAEEVFLHRFVKSKQWKNAHGDDESDASSVADEEFDQMIDQLLSGKEEIDFAEGIGKIPSKKGKKSKGNESSEEDEEDEEEEDDDNEDARSTRDQVSGDEIGEESDFDLSDEEDAEDITFDGDEEEEKNFKFSMSDVENDDDDDDDDLSDSSDHIRNGENNQHMKGRGKMKPSKGVDRNLFASADEFAQILEDTGDFHAKHRSLALMNNKDNAAVKQLKWELSRNQWLQGQKRRPRHGKAFAKSAKKFKRK